MTPSKLPDTAQFHALAEAAPFTVYDIGARGGEKDDFDRISKAIDLVLFEPEPAAFAALQSTPNSAYRSVTPKNIALGRGTDTVCLNVCASPGCSSGLTPLGERAAPFGRAEYYDVTQVVEVPVRGIDDLIASNDLVPAHFVKIDIQGMELDVFEGGAALLSNHTLGIRTEVNFLPMYEGLPLWGDLDTALRRFGFQPMRFIEFHEWRRKTRKKYPKIDRSIDLPAGRGQMVHADVLYLKPPELFDGTTPDGALQLARLALLAACYGHFDHAFDALSRPGMNLWRTERQLGTPDSILRALSEAEASVLETTARAQRFGNRIMGLLHPLLGR